MQTDRDTKAMHTALRDSVGSTIYVRGLEYYKHRNVRTWNATDEPDGSCTVVGSVRGTELYHVEATYYPEDGGFWDIECDCPYSAACKHGVALALTYIQSQEASEVRQATTHPSEHDHFSHTLHNADTNEVTQQRTPFDASEYQVVLHSTREYMPTLHPHTSEYTNTQAHDLLNTHILTDDERVVLESLHIAGGHPYASSFSEYGIDPTTFFLALARTTFNIRVREGHYERSRPIMLDADPPPLKLSIVHHAIESTVDTHRITHHSLFLTLTNERKPHAHAARSRYTAFTDSVLHETDTQLRIHLVGQPLATTIDGMAPLYDANHVDAEFIAVGTDLRYDTIRYLRDLDTASIPAIELDGQDILRALTVYDTKPTRLFVIALDMTEHTLRVRPCANYGAWRSDLSESIHRSYSGRTRYKHRITSTAHNEYALTEIDEELHLALLDDRTEIALYKELEKHHDMLGFTKTLKCFRRGKSQVERFLQDTWPKLNSFAGQKGYEILYDGDTLPEEQATFTADFSSDIDTENDWLHFDVDLYCAGDRVSLDELHTFIDSGETYWRKKDGTLVEVENREELERLVRLLRTFRAGKDGGFEGNLHHAPELSYVMTSSPHYNAAQTKSLQDFMERVESGKPLKAVRIPKHIKDVARPYQLEGIKWLHFLRSYRFAGILADDMGLGKTLQTLTVLAMTKKTGVPSLVVCPKSLLYNWQHESLSFFPRLKVLVYDGSPNERKALLPTLTEHDIVVVSYNTLKRDADILCAPGRHYNYAVLDEAQYIKNHMTKMAQRVKEIPADYRLALTGTPLENHVFELWSIYDYLMPGFLGRHDHFNERFQKPIMDAGDTDALEHLRRKVEPFMLRRTKNEVLKDLPPKVEQTRECVLSDAQNVLYQQVLVDVRGTVNQAVEEKGFKGSQIHILAGLTKLRQVCNHPALLTKDDPDLHESTKLDACIELIEEVRQGDRKVLVFSQFTGMLDILAHALNNAGIGYTYLSGKTRKRQEVITRFNTDPDVTAFLISMKAGGTGLNLTAADTVVVFDPWWNPSVEQQAIDRAHRIGQTRSVNVYRLLTRGTIEDKMQALKRKKRSVFDAVVSETGDLLQKLTWEDIRELFSE